MGKIIAVMVMLVMGLLASIDHDAKAEEKPSIAMVQSMGKGDFEQGLAHIIRLAQDGNSAATFLYAQLFLETDQPDHFIKYLTLAAEQGHPTAMKFLATGYLKGEFVPQDYAQARFWFEQAAARHNINAMVYLGLMNRDGGGMAADYERAFFWFTLASRLKPQEEGHQEPAYFAEELRDHLTPTAIDTITQEAEAWISNHPPPAPIGIPPLSP